MKRKREQTVSDDIPCPYAGCAKVFRTNRALSRHVVTHEASAPIKCSEESCSRRFGTRSEMLQHTYEVHQKKGPKKGSGAVLVPEGCFETDQFEVVRAADLSKEYSGISKELRDEADEIADNAAYFSDQMKVARVRWDHSRILFRTT